LYFQREVKITYKTLVVAAIELFAICEFILTNRNLKKDQFNLDAEFTVSGVVRITQLQTREGYAYIKP